MNFSNFSTSRVRTRCARMYSTAGTSRELRNVLGQSLGACPFSVLTWPSRVMSSNAAAPSASNKYRMPTRSPWYSTGVRVTPVFFRSESAWPELPHIADAGNTHYHREEDDRPDHHADQFDKAG